MHGATTARRLRLHQSELALDELERVTNVDLLAVEVDVRPLQSKCLTLAQPRRKRHREQSPESMRLDGIQKRAGL